jgi:signal peptidase II
MLAHPGREWGVDQITSSSAAPAPAADASFGAALRARRSLLIAAAITVVLDVAVKLATVRWLSDSTVDLGPLTLRLVHNEGVAFGLGDQVPTVLLLAVTAGVTIVLGVLAWRGALVPQFAAGMIVAGAACNAIDRAIGGSVIDTFSLSFFPPVFNVADVALDVGLVIILIAMLLPQNDAPVEGADASPVGPSDGAADVPSDRVTEGDATPAGRPDGTPTSAREPG